MTITHKIEDGKMTIKLKGRLDTVTAPELEAYLVNVLDDVKLLVLDLESLDYISSAGLRVLLSMQKKMKKQGSMEIIKAQDQIKEVFELTGFDNVLTIK